MGWSLFRVQLENGHIITAHISGKCSMHTSDPSGDEIIR